jgi:hypothetical protein
VRHVDRCIEARLDSYQRAYEVARSIPTDQEFIEVWKNVQEAKEQQIRHCMQALRQFMGARGLDGDPTDSLRARSGHAHDRALGKWKIWQGQVHLLPKPEVAKPPLAPVPEVAKPPLSDKSLFIRWAAILWPLGSVLLSVILAVAIEQYPEFFRHDTWILPVCTWAALPCWILPLLFHERAKRWYRTVSSIPRVGMVAAPVFALAFLVFLILGSVTLLRFHRSHLAEALKRELAPAEPRQKSGSEASTLPPGSTIPVNGTKASPAGGNGNQGARQIELLFKDSPLFTESRKARITKDASRVNKYLESLGIAVPIAIPAIGIDTGAADPSAHGYSTSFDKPRYYYNEFTFEPKTLDNDEEITQAFVSYDVTLLLNKPEPPALPNPDVAPIASASAGTDSVEQKGMQYKWMASLTISGYLNQSLWGKGPMKEKVPGCPEAFWKLRTRYGQPFTDKLAIFMLRALVDEPYRDNTQHFGDYFYERLKMADSVIDNENAKFPDMKAVLQECRWFKQ